MSESIDVPAGCTIVGCVLPRGAGCLLRGVSAQGESLTRGCLPKGCLPGGTLPITCLDILYLPATTVAGGNKNTYALDGISTVCVKMNGITVSVWMF